MWRVCLCLLTNNIALFDRESVVGSWELRVKSYKSWVIKLPFLFHIYTRPPFCVFLFVCTWVEVVERVERAEISAQRRRYASCDNTVDTMEYTPHTTTYI